MTVSIIITCKGFSANLEECIQKCKALDYPDYEIIVLPDENFNIQETDIKIIATGNVLPAKKRDLALAHAKGEVLAFLDDDAYPDKNWLKNAARHFENADIAAVGGPAVTPDSDSMMKKASGLIYASSLVSANYAYRYKPGIRVFVDDYPSCNFIVRKGIFQEIGGFDTAFWPGEDTILCLKIKEMRKKILYDPEVLVFHHRRPLYSEHLRQVSNYALHRGYFVKRFPGNSLKFTYFVPTIFILGLILAPVLSVFSPFVNNLYLGAWAFYLFLVFIFSLNKDLRLIPLVFSGIILTHIAYGVNFLKGLVSKKLKEE